MLLCLFFDFSLSTCPRKMETEKWPKAADSPLLCNFIRKLYSPTEFVVTEIQGTCGISKIFYDVEGHAKHILKCQRQCLGHVKCRVIGGY